MRHFITFLLVISVQAFSWDGDCDSGTNNWCWLPNSSSGNTIESISYSDTEMRIKLTSDVYVYRLFSENAPASNAHYSDWHRQSLANYRAMFLALNGARAQGTPVSLRGWWTTVSGNHHLVVTEIKLFD